MSLLFLPCRVGIMLVLCLPDPAKGSVIMSSSCSCGVWVLGGFKRPCGRIPLYSGSGWSFRAGNEAGRGQAAYPRHYSLNS